MLSLGDDSVVVVVFILLLLHLCICNRLVERERVGCFTVIALYVFLCLNCTNCWSYLLAFCYKNLLLRKK